MKTSEFIKKVKGLGYDTESNKLSVRVYDDHYLMASVYEESVNMVTTNLNSNLNGDIPNELFDLCVEYARTPVEERNDDKKYHLYNPLKNDYFNYHKIDKYYTWDTLTQTDEIQTEFTREEIKNHKFRDIMELLVKEEV